MNELLDLALKMHGDLERWREVKVSTYASH